MIIAASVLGSIAVAVSPAQTATPASDLAGTWEGPLPVGGRSIRIVFRIRPDGTAVMDSPDQGARDIPVDTPTLEGGVVRLTVPSLRGRFEGRRSDDGAVLTGVLAQGGVTLPLVLTRTSTTVAELARPQTPVPPFPYRAEEVAFDNAEASGVRLAGTLTLPEGEGPFPAAILVSGSGPQDRDETVFGHKPFAVWADALTRRGIAVLRYDDRGTAASTGDFAAATSADFATDADAAFAYLAARPEIDGRCIGLIGHSEGGTIAPLVAQEGVPVAWIVMLAGPAVSGGALLIEQSRATQIAMGVSPGAVDANVAIQTRIMSAVAENAASADATIAAVDAVLADAGLSVAQRQAQARQTGSAWTRWFIAHDPGPALAGLDVPLLALYGGKDVQVPADQNAPALSRLKPDDQVVVLPNLNHLMQPATTGLPNEYEAIETTIDSEALTTVVNWVAAQGEAGSARR
ncbi:MAG: alpha/beta hydrolase [Alphaproteobacteria bacterium]|nr:MAG: alpha/beta hydrolase [Alphaproteobacteria bacterium]